MSMSSNHIVTAREADQNLDLYPRLSEDVRISNQFGLAERVMQEKPEYYRDIPESRRAENGEWVQQILIGPRLFEDFRYIPARFWQRHDRDHSLLKRTLQHYPDLRRHLAPQLLQEFGMYVDPGTTLDQAKAAIKKNPSAYYQALDEFRQHPDVADVLVKYHPQEYAKLPLSLRSHADIGPKLAKRLFRHPTDASQQYYSSIPPVIRDQNESLAERYLKSIPPGQLQKEHIDQIPSALWENSTKLATAAVAGTPRAYSYVPRLLRENEPSLGKRATDEDPSLYQHVPHKQRLTDMDMARSVLSRKPDMMQYVPPDLMQRIPDVVLDAVQRDHTQAGLAPVNTLANQPQLLRDIAQPNFEQYRTLAPAVLERDPQLALEAVRANPDNYQYVPTNIKGHTQHGIDLMRLTRGKHYDKVPDYIRTAASSIILDAKKVKEDVPQHLHVAYHAAEKAIAQHGANYEFVPAIFKQEANSWTLRLARKAVKKDRKVYEKVPFAIREFGGQKLADIAIDKTHLLNYDFVPRDLQPGVRERTMDLAKEAVTEDAGVYYENVPLAIKKLGGLEFALSAVDHDFSNFQTVPKDLQDAIMQNYILNSTIDNPKLGRFRRRDNKWTKEFIHNMRLLCGKVKTQNPEKDRNEHHIPFWIDKAIIDFAYLFDWNEKHRQYALWQPILLRMTHFCLTMLWIRTVELVSTDPMRARFLPPFQTICDKANEHLEMNLDSLRKHAQMHEAEIKIIEKFQDKCGEVLGLLERDGNFYEEILDTYTYFYNYVKKNHESGKTLFQYPIGIPEVERLQYKQLTAE